MDRFFKPRSICDDKDPPQSTTKKARIELNLEDLPTYPGLRKKISEYDVNDRDMIRRKYIQDGPCQPRVHDFPKTKIEKLWRRFCPSWFNEFPTWLEYSVDKDAAFCLPCYLFRPNLGNKGGGDSFVGEGFKNWNKKERFDKHIGGHGSAHNTAYANCQDLMNQNQHIQVVINKQSHQARSLYRTRLSASVDCIRLILRQGLAFRGHVESENSSNQGNFRELLKFLANHNDDIKNVIFKNAPENNQLTSPTIQKDIVSAAAIETTNMIIDDLGGDLFAVMVDESRDISDKEQMDIAIRYVDKRGRIMERFLGIIHVSDTSSLSLKVALESLLSKHGLTISRIRGHGYDGASNMRGEFNGLKSLILKENSSAFYVHCFAHQLQLTLVALANDHIEVASFFNLIAILLNVIKGSCKRQDLLRDLQSIKVKNALASGEILSGRGSNQEQNLKRVGETRWGSHYGTLLSLLGLFSSVVNVLETIMEDGKSMEQRAEAKCLLDSMHSFDFVFVLHLMRRVLGITNDLSQALQNKDQDIANVVELLEVSKQRLQDMRDDGLDSLFEEVCLFCNSHCIQILDMNEQYVKGRSRRKAKDVSNLHHFRVELLYNVVDIQLQELNDRFTETTTELFRCLACFNPSDNFAAFDKWNLICLAQLYPCDFSEFDVLALGDQIENFIYDMRRRNDFFGLKGVGSLAEKLVETKKNLTYPLVYLLLKLILILPLVTATVERVFLAMNIVKSRLRNRMRDDLLSNCLVTYIEKDVFDNVQNEAIIQKFQNMKTRREQL